MMITYKAKTYSNGRTTVMGIAALLIVWFHSCISLPEGSLFLLQKQTSDIGVDMFLFASGVGVHFAWKKNSHYVSYMMSRMRRVLVPFLIVAIPWFGYHDIIIGHSRRLFLKDVSMLTFWTEGRMTFWFVSAILILYVVTPLYLHFDAIARKKHCHLSLLFTAAIYGIMIFAPGGVLRSVIGPAMIFFPRIPVYFMGLSFGKAIEEERVFHIPLWALLGILAACGVTAAAAMGYFQWQLPPEFKYLAHGPAAVILSCMFAGIPSNKFCNYFGKRSLEVYLLLEKVQFTLGEHPELSPLMRFSAIPFFTLTFIITLVLVEVVRWIASPFQKISRRQKT